MNSAFMYNVNCMALPVDCHWKIPSDFPYQFPPDESVQEILLVIISLQCLVNDVWWLYTPLICLLTCPSISRFAEALYYFTNRDSSLVPFSNKVNQLRRFNGILSNCLKKKNLTLIAVCRDLWMPGDSFWQTPWLDAPSPLESLVGRELK